MPLLLLEDGSSLLTEESVHLLLEAPVTPTSTTTFIGYTLLMDLTGTAFGSAPTWTDVTAYMLPGRQAGQITDGRQDESSDVNPSQFTFTLDNRDGRFTPNNASGPYYPHVKAGVHVRLEVTVNATTVEYYDGYADSFDTYVGPDRAWGLCDVVCTDVLGRLGRTTPLRSMLIEETIAQSPYAYVPMTDTLTLWQTTTLAKPLVLVSGTGAQFNSTTSTLGSYSFGATGPYGDISGGLTIADYSASDGYGYELTSGSGWVLSGTVFAAGVWFHNSVAVTGRPLTMITTANEALGVNISQPSGSSLTVKGFVGSTLSTGTAGVWGKGKWHFLGVEVTATGTGPYTVTVNVYVDGALVETTSASLTSKTISAVQIGGQFISGASSTLIPGDYAHFAVWTAGAPSWSTLWNVGSNGLAHEAIPTRIARLLGYRAPSVGVVTSGVYSGDVGLPNLDGQSVQQALFDTAHVEAAPLYADGQGRIVLLNRGQMTSPTVAVTLDASAGDLMPALRVRSDNSYIVNDFTVTPSSGNAQHAQDTTSQGTYGYYSGSLDAPFGSDSDASTVASLVVSNMKDPQAGAAQLVVDLFALAQHDPALVASLLAVRTGGVVALTNLPAPFTAFNVMVQGRDLTFTTESAILTMFTTGLAVGVASSPTASA